MAAEEGRAEELLSCLPGTRLLVWYSDDTMWHERILVWKASETSWYIVTPDFDVYEESYTLSGEGPSRFKIKGVHVQYYSRLHAPVYQFAEAPSQEEMRGFIELVLDELGYESVPADGWRPAEVIIGRRRVSTSLLLG